MFRLFFDLVCTSKAMMVIKTIKHKGLYLKLRNDKY